MTDPPHLVVDNPAKDRYELAVEGEVAFLDYRRRDTYVILVHTEVPEALRGRGLAGMLARHGFEDARRLGLGVIVKCPYVTTWLKRHPEYNDLVLARAREERA